MIFLMACGASDSAVTDTMDSGCADQPSPTWTDTALVVGAGCSGGSFTLGIVQTGAADGWAGEDCLDAVPDGFTNVGDGGVQVCHHVDGGGTTLPIVGTREEVTETTTLFRETDAPTLTWALWDDEGPSCWTWGDDVTYYAACTVL